MQCARLIRTRRRKKSLDANQNGIRPANAPSRALQTARIDRRGRNGRHDALGRGPASGAGSFATKAYGPPEISDATPSLRIQSRSENNWSPRDKTTAATRPTKIKSNRRGTRASMVPRLPVSLSNSNQAACTLRCRRLIGAAIETKEAYVRPSAAQQAAFPTRRTSRKPIRTRSTSHARRAKCSPEILWQP